MDFVNWRSRAYTNMSFSGEMNRYEIQIALTSLFSFRCRHFFKAQILIWRK